jgi:glutamate carboxypeptidase
METLTDPAELERIRSHVAGQLPAFLGDLERLVNIDCGSYTKVGVDEVGRWIAEALTELGAEVSIEPGGELGDTVVGRLRGTGDGPTVLLIGHMDTVFDPGTAAERPFRVEQGVAYGPGVTDMKAGLLAGLYALRTVRSLARGAEWLPVREIVFIANPDEEIGSPVSTTVIHRWAQRADVALVLECARANGDIVSSRKGILDLELHIEGRAAHAGIEPEKGRSATLEAAHKTVALHALNGRWPSVTVNVGVARGGTRPNVVASSAVLQVDIRAARREALERAEQAVRQIAETSTVPDTRCEVVEIGHHWPMEKLERSGRLVERAQAIASALGFELDDAATGGASDANTTAGMGVPTLDGLGPVGGDDHAPTEYLEIDSIVPRTALLAALLLAIGRDREIAGWSRASGAGSRIP